MEIDHCPCSGKTLDRLIRPVVLALLQREDTHGYDLVRQLHALDVFGDCPPDTSGVYKVLKSMKQEGLVSATWEMGDTGPAKRLYTLTRNGNACLERWAATLRTYRSQIDAILAIVKPGNPGRRSGQRATGSRRRPSRGPRSAVAARRTKALPDVPVESRNIKGSFRQGKNR